MITPYASLEQLKTHLGITDDSQDVLLSSLLSLTYGAINAILDVDSLNESTYVEQFKLDDIHTNGQIYVKNHPVISLTKINDTAYTGTLNTDYAIFGKRQLWIDDLNDYINNSDFPFFTLTYKAGYSRSKTDTDKKDSLPDEIKLVHLKLCAQEYNLMKTAGVSNYALGDESMTLNSSITMTDPVVQKILSKYRKANVI